MTFEENDADREPPDCIGRLFYFEVIGPIGRISRIGPIQNHDRLSHLYPALATQSLVPAIVDRAGYL